MTNPFARPLLAAGVASCAGVAALCLVGCAPLAAGATPGAAPPAPAAPTPATAAVPPSWTVPVPSVTIPSVTLPGVTVSGGPGPAAAPAATPPAPPGPKGPRPRNGAVIDAYGDRGEGEVKAENGLDQDGMLTLARDGAAVRSVYVHAHDTATLSGVADGSYEVWFTTGDGWNADLERFTANTDYERFPGVSDFSTTRDEYSIWTFTLQETPDGNVTTQPVDPAQYPR